MTKQFLFFFFPKMPLYDGTFRYSTPFLPEILKFDFPLTK